MYRVSTMKPKSSSSAKPTASDKQSLISNESEDLSEAPQATTKRPQQNSSGTSQTSTQRCCIVLFTYLSIFLFGVFCTLFGIELQKICAHHQSSWCIGVGEQTSFTDEEIGGQESLQQEQPIDFIKFAPSPAAVCPDTCVFSIVESIPQNLTYGPEQYVHRSTYDGLKMLLSSAKKSVQIASFYWTLRGNDIAFHDSTANDGEDLFNSLLELGKNDKVSLRIVQNAVNNDTTLLVDEGHAEVCTLNFTHLLGKGVLHTKFWLVDGQHFYIGSANLDWRSLTQVKELGVLVQNCPCLGQDLQKIFDVYWYLGKSDATVPDSWPAVYNTSINSSNPIVVHFNNSQAPVYLSSSPAPLCPGGRTEDIDAILDVIHQSEHFVYIAVMDYSPTTLYLQHNKYWPVIDDALRRAAFDRRVSVRILASKWAHTMKDMYAFLCSLSSMGHLHYPRTKMEVKLFEVPVYSKNQSQIPYARVNHNKYMVTDQHAYIGTSNWSGDYFINTAGVAFVLKQPEGTINTTAGNLRQQLYDVFIRDWYSNFTMPLYCDFNSTHPNTEEL